MSVLAASIINEVGKKSSEITLQSNFTIKVTYKVLTSQKNVICAVGITHQNIPINTTWTQPADFQEGTYHSYFHMDLLHLAIGTYMIHVGLSIGKSSIQYISDALTFTIALDKFSNANIVSYEVNTGLIINQMKFETIKDTKDNF
jgi:hypothetical protein